MQGYQKKAQVFRPLEFSDWGKSAKILALLPILDMPCSQQCSIITILFSFSLRMTTFLKYDYSWCEFVYSLLSFQISLVYTVGTSGQKSCIVLMVYCLKKQMALQTKSTKWRSQKLCHKQSTQFQKYLTHFIIRYYYIFVLQRMKLRMFYSFLLLI